LADLVPDAPSIAARFFSATAPGEVRIERRPGEDLDLLCTAGGDRLWKLLVNLATGGKMFGLRKFDYFQNLYFAQVPYRLHNAQPDFWVRCAADLALTPSASSTRNDGAVREQRLTQAVAAHAVIRIEAQRVADGRAAFLHMAEMRFEEEIHIDQEALHFDPVA